jgi:enoyl-CoA hydratase
VITERLVFAMPETGIGLFPDVGGSHFLSRLPGELGMYMALTGARLTPADAVFAGVGDCLIEGAREEELIAALSAADYSAGMPAAAVDGVLTTLAQEAGAAEVAALQPAIDRCFAAETLEEIGERLRREGSDWARQTLETMATKSPTSMRIAFRQIRRGKSLSFNECMRMEYRIANGCIRGHDFYEGVRAVVIDKDQAPAWRPARLEDVGDSDVDSYFDAVPEGGDLQIPYEGQMEGRAR